MAPNVGIVIIGRNEGPRLHASLASALRDARHVVYVDSGSTDNSVQIATELGAHVVVLDTTAPFTAARSRNAGFAKLLELAPEVEFVQFVDGDCEIVEGWIDRALSQMTSSLQNGVICGRRRERFPSASIYNKLADIEWDTPAGPTRACGGDALIRVKAFQQVDGYNPTLIAGEEPEMCVRLRAVGWQIYRIDADMTLHDAAMTQFSQWWKRAFRAGHAYAEGFAMHGTPPESHNAHQVMSIRLWALIVPLIFVVATIATALIAPRYAWIPALLLLLYPLMILKIAVSKRFQNLGSADSLIYGFFVMLGKLPQLCGMRAYRRSISRGGHTTLIEYKDPPSQNPTGSVTSVTLKQP
ncbi:MAG TPA: glycosyltransferase [Tepidisphaeraceae bacterium]|jgi:glycosyltransferase involved in cell wall biosynthesis|nr:glycosyltransferase [Tepidisphaeraceae bacterium]